MRRCLKFAAMSRGIAEQELDGKVTECAQQLGIADRLDMKAGELSRGLRQRLAIAQAIIHRPKFLLLDEPAAGLDPEARHGLSLLFQELRDSGMTLLISSHILSELEEYSTDMLVIRNGRIIDHTAIGGEEAATLLEVRLAVPHPGVEQLVRSLAGVDQVVVTTDRITFNFVGGTAEQHLLLRELLNQGAPVYSFTEQRRNMQDAYLKTVADTGNGGSSDENEP